MKKIKLNKSVEISRITHGHWRLKEWNLTNQELLKLTQQNCELGITTFDHADIYGDYECEKLFGDALILKKELRKKIQLITKCGIKLLSEKYPKRNVKYYDYSYNHIISSVENSLKNLRTDYIDVLLLHRPSPFFNPQEVAEAFATLKKSGKVLNFGVSNFNPQQFELLNSFLNEELVTNQIEISPYYIEHFTNGTLEFLQKKKIKPMAWSPLAGGKFFNPKNEKEQQIVNTLKKVAKELNVESIDKIIYSWLLKHPSDIIPVVGTSDIKRIEKAIDALNIEMTLEQWFEIYIAAFGEELP